jgi:hypothetical protein
MPPTVPSTAGITTDLPVPSDRGVAHDPQHARSTIVLFWSVREQKPPFGGRDTLASHGSAGGNAV